MLDNDSPGLFALPVSPLQPLDVFPESRKRFLRLPLAFLSLTLAELVQFLPDLGSLLSPREISSYVFPPEFLGP